MGWSGLGENVAAFEVGWQGRFKRRGNAADKKLRERIEYD
jgi:hypothetical protein